jgi:hypothetical protein
MRGLSSRVSIAAFSGAIACIALPVSAAATHGPLASAGATARAANTTTFEDSAGENANAPDIASVVVSNTDAAQVTFRVAIPNRSELTGDMIIELDVDSDNTETTGDPDSLGADYAIQVFQGAVDLYKWDGSRFSRTGVPQTSLVYSYASGALTIKVSAAELGNTKRFKFGIFAIGGVVFDPNTGNIDFSNARADLAPDPGHGLWSYDVKVAPLRLVVKSFSTAPNSPSAGRSFSAFLVAARSDSGAVLKGGRVTCVATVGGRPLRAGVHRVAGGRATCTWAIPASARGQTIRGSVAVAFEGLTARKSFSATIR